ncbi:MAG: hypothetical protein R3Y22_04400 [Bacteroidales bacterium]
MGNSSFDRLFESKEEIAQEQIEADATSQPEIIEMGTTEEPPVKKKKGGCFKRGLIWIVVIAIVGGALWIYLNYFNPYVVDAQKVGYISSVEKKGIIFKTYEGELINHNSGGDSENAEFDFSFASDSLAIRAMDIQGTTERVKVKYRKYNGAIPWRGDSEYVVFDIQTP